MTPPSPRHGSSPPLTDGTWVRTSPSQPDTRLEEDLAKVDTWLRQYVGRPDPQLGRNGPVCPFVPPALNDNAIQFSFYYDVDGSSGSHIREVLERELADFSVTAEQLPKSGTSLESRLVVLPDTGPEGWRRLDEVYEALKNTAVSSGLMIGQFHPLCDERAVRNPAFRVSVAPVGLFAMRRMAPHDVLFLHERHSWLRTYDDLFRSHYERGRVRDPLLRELYQHGLEKHGMHPLTLTTKEK